MSKLKDDLYTFLVTDHVAGSEITARIIFNAKSSVYSGHFPGHPITPGACQVMVIKEILGELLEIPLMLSKAKTIKFTSIHEPAKVKEINARINYRLDENGVFNVDAQLFEGDARFLSFKGEFVQYV